MMEDKRPFNLQDGEKVIRAIKPAPALRNYMFARWLFFTLLVGIWFIWLPFIIPHIQKSVAAVFVIVIVFLLVGLIHVLAGNAYRNQHYWITNKRIVYKRGIFGYMITSIPFERISDIILSRTLLERIFGFGSLLVESLAGQISNHDGSEGHLLAVENPEELQEEIFELIKAKRKKEKLTM